MALQKYFELIVKIWGGQNLQTQGLLRQHIMDFWCSIMSEASYHDKKIEFAYLKINMERNMKKRQQKISFVADIIHLDFEFFLIQ